MQRQGGHSGHGGEHTGHNGQSQYEAIRNKESKIAGASLENGMAVDSDGNVIPGSEKEGTDSNIIYTHEEVEAMKGAASYTHNHPNGSSLSGEDFYMAYGMEIGEMRAVTSDVVFVMQPPEGKTWKQSYNMTQVAAIGQRLSGRKGFTEADNQKYEARVAAVGERQALREWSHKNMEKTAKRYGFRYRMEPRE